jgi:Golgi SNAP receptor complex protein 1
LQVNVQQAIDQSNLLSGVRNDIESVSQKFESPLWLFKPLENSAYKSSAAESLLAERSRIDGSHAMTDEMLE